MKRNPYTFWLTTLACVAIGVSIIVFFIGLSEPPARYGATSTAGGAAAAATVLFAVGFTMAMVAVIIGGVTWKPPVERPSTPPTV